MPLEQTDSSKEPKKKYRLLKSYVARTYFALGICAVLAILITYVLYNYTQQLLVQRLQDRIIAIAATAATQVDAKDLEALHNPNDLNTPQAIKVIGQLNEIKNANKDITYAYIMRRTSDPDVLEFIADAESLLTPAELDFNGNGSVEEDEVAPLPGDPFEIHSYPVLKDEAFYHPAADRELEQDQWSVQMSAYAPIINDFGDSVAILGIDVEVSDFRVRTQQTLAPFLLFIIFLILLLSLLTTLLVRFYGERVHILQEIDRQKDELMSIVSHQLATPVSSVKWYLEMLLDGDVGKLSSEQMEYLRTMQSVSHDLADLVSMILDVSRIQLGRMKVDPQELNIGDFVNEIINVIEPKAKEKQVNFVKNIPSEWPAARWDKRLTRMTLENLLSNAVKYTPKNGLVTLSVVLKSNNFVYFEIKDTGCGIPEKEQSKMFQKQYRASNVGNIEGNGFGLYVAKGAVEAQGGKIWFESYINKGTTFMFELPLRTDSKK